jgi:predicted O-methyltransferase YrrM
MRHEQCVMSSPAQPSPAQPSNDEIERWYAGKDFTSDWTSWHFTNWSRILAPFRDAPVRMLEIGSWEGRSALFFLNYLAHSQMVCVDTFGGNVEHHRNPYFAALVPETERKFDANTAEFAARIEKRKGPSFEVLPQLGIESRRFDIAYIDGSHRAADVYSDAVLTWPMVAASGVVIFDDYEFDQMEEEIERPKLGIDAFLKATDGQFRLLLKDYQVVIEKIAPRTS